MGEYSYGSLGYKPQEKNRQGSRTQQEWNKTGVEAYSDGWSKKTGFARNGEEGQDLVCTYIIDGEGRKIISCSPNTESFVTKSETIIEHVYAPSVTGYRNGSPTKVTPMKDYGVVKSGRGRTRSPSHDRPLEEYDFYSHVPTEANRPSTYRHQTPKTNTHGGNTGYGGQNIDIDTNGWRSRPGVNTRPDVAPEATMITKGGGGSRPMQPTHVSWATPPSYDSPLAKVGNWNEGMNSPSVTKAATQPRWTEPPLVVSKVDTYTPTIDSKEAARKYGALPTSSPVVKIAESYTPTIDSRKAAEKYQGVLL